MDSDEAYDRIKQRFANTGVTPMLQEDRDVKPLLILLPGSLEAQGPPKRGPWLNGRAGAGDPGDNDVGRRLARGG